MDFQKLITGHIINHFNIIRKTYRWIILVCLLVFWSIFIKQSTVKILGLEIEPHQISIVLYLLITGTSLYVIERLRRISILVNQLDTHTKRDALFEVMVHDWLLNPFAYQQNVIAIEKENKFPSKLDFHLNALKITVIPTIHIFMTLVLAKKQGYEMEVNMNNWLIKVAYIVTTIGIIRLLQWKIKSIDTSFISNNNKDINFIIRQNQKIRDLYFKVLTFIGIAVFIIAFYFGFAFIDLFIHMIMNIYSGNVEIVN